MKKITLEEAFIVPGQEKLVAEHSTHPEFLANYDKLIDITGQRLEVMEANEIDISVLSITSPGIQGINNASSDTSLAHEWNNYLADAISKRPDRFKGFAVLPTREPECAAKELQHCINELGFVGALINGDAPEYLDFWRTASQLNVPIYLHPRPAPANQMTTYDGFPELKDPA